MKRVLKTLLGENFSNLKKLFASLLVVALCMGFLVGIPKAKAQKEMFLVMAVGFKWYQLNGMSYQMEVAPEIINREHLSP